MSLNNYKFVYMCVTHKTTPLSFRYDFNNHSLVTLNEYKYIGVIITSNSVRIVIKHGLRRKQ